MSQWNGTTIFCSSHDIFCYTYLWSFWLRYGNTRRRKGGEKDFVSNPGSMLSVIWHIIWHASKFVCDAPGYMPIFSIWRSCISFRTAYIESYAIRYYIASTYQLLRSEQKTEWKSEMIVSSPRIEKNRIRFWCTDRSRLRPKHRRIIFMFITPLADDLPHMYPVLKDRDRLT